MLCLTCGRAIVRTCRGMIECHIKGKKHYLTIPQDVPTECLFYVSSTEFSIGQQIREEYKKKWGL